MQGCTNALAWALGFGCPVAGKGRRAAKEGVREALCHSTAPCVTLTRRHVDRAECLAAGGGCHPPGETSLISQVVSSPLEQLKPSNRDCSQPTSTMGSLVLCFWGSRVGTTGAAGATSAAVGRELHGALMANPTAAEPVTPCPSAPHAGWLWQAPTACSAWVGLLLLAAAALNAHPSPAQLGRPAQGRFEQPAQCS